MAPMKRYAKKQTKAIKCRRLNAQQRLRQQRAQAPPEIPAPIGTWAADHWL